MRGEEELRGEGKKIFRTKNLRARKIFGENFSYPEAKKWGADRGDLGCGQEVQVEPELCKRLILLLITK